jgi:hypothetical protein
MCVLICIYIEQNHKVLTAVFTPVYGVLAGIFYVGFCFFKWMKERKEGEEKRAGPTPPSCLTTHWWSHPESESMILGSGLSLLLASASKEIRRQLWIERFLSFLFSLRPLLDTTAGSRGLCPFLDRDNSTGQKSRERRRLGFFYWCIDLRVRQKMRLCQPCTPGLTAILHYRPQTQGPFFFFTFVLEFKLKASHLLYH